MRICIVTVAAHGIGGMQDHTRDLAAGLVGVGHDVEVLAGRHPDDVAVETRDGARWWYLPDAPKRERVPRRNPRWLRATYDKFAELHREAPFDVVHSESTSAIELVRRGVHRRVPLVTTLHGNVISLVRASLQRARRGEPARRSSEAKHLVWLGLEHFQYGHWYRFRACEWMAVSQQQFEDTRKALFLRADRGHVVPNGIDTTRFRPRDRAETSGALGVPPGPLVVGVGRLNAEKSFDLALRAVAALDPALGDAARRRRRRRGARRARTAHRGARPRSPGAVRRRRSPPRTSPPTWPQPTSSCSRRSARRRRGWCSPRRWPRVRR